MRVFGVGLQKTGTTTLGACLTQLGLRMCLTMPSCSPRIDKASAKEFSRRSRGTTAAKTTPWLLLYQDFDRIYPDARFILTVRRSEDI